jgi:hypothetical protein
MKVEIKNLEELKGRALEIYDGMEIARYGEESKIEFNEKSREILAEDHWYSNNSVVSFVSDGKLYAIPSMRSVYKILREAMGEPKSLWVYFSNGDRPKKEARIWKELLSDAEEDSDEMHREECEEYAAKHGCGHIDKNLLSQCFRIGRHDYIRVKTSEGTGAVTTLCYSVFGGGIELVGKANYKNGIIVFVYADGDTYVTRNWDIWYNLLNAGYTRDNIDVPFSEGEEILDKEYAKRWAEVARL